MNKFIILLFCTLLVVSSCKNTKDISRNEGKKIPSKVLVRNIENADLSYRFLQAKARVQFNDGNNKQSFTANIRIAHQKKIWLSLTGPFGIEGARILIEPNRIQIINKLNGTYEDKPFSYINQYVPFTIDIDFLENILVGNRFDINASKIDDVHYLKDGYEIHEVTPSITAKYLIDFDYKYKTAQFSQYTANQDVQLSFNDYRFIEDKLFAFIRDLVYKDNDEHTMTLNLQFSKVKKEENLTFPFSVPERLKK